MPDAVAAQSVATSRNRFGTILVRLVVPLWVLAGAAFKLYERNPGNLPSVIRDISRSFGLENLDLLLRVLIGCEFFAVAVMFLLPRLSRAMAIFMLSCFCLILIGEMIKGATSCGCFGSLPVKPWQMLVVDGTLLALVVIFPSRSTSAQPFGGLLTSALAMAAISMGLALIVPQPPVTRQPVVAINDHPAPPATGPSASQPDKPADVATQPATSATAVLPDNVNPAPKALPASWYTQEMEKWVGKPWRELDIFQLMPRWPRNMDAGKHYVIFYSRTCEHCKTMLDEDLLIPLDGPVTLVQVPASRTLLTDPGGWPMPAHVESSLHAELLDLPLGPNWIITTPLVIAVKDGKVTCAAEGEHKHCLGLE